MKKKSNNELIDSMQFNFLKPNFIGTFQDIIPVILPMFHIYGMSTICFSRMSIGNKLVTLPKFTPESFIKVLDQNKV